MPDIKESNSVLIYPCKGSQSENIETEHYRVNHDDVSKGASIKLLSECWKILFSQGKFLL